MPGTGEGFTIVAKRTPEIHWSVPLPGPDRHGVPFELVDEVEGVARVGVEAALYLLTRLGPERPLVTDDLDARDPLTVLMP